MRSSLVNSGLANQKDEWCSQSVRSPSGSCTHTSELRIRLFGDFQVTVDGVPAVTVDAPRLQSLVAWLVVHAAKPAPKERLASLMWPDSTGPQARTNLRQLLHHLRRALPVSNSFLRVDHSSVQWVRNPSCTIDIVEFGELLAHAANARETKDLASELQTLKRAAQIYVDDVMPGAFDSWLKPVRDGLRGKLCVALSRLASLLEEAGSLVDALEAAERLVAHEPTREASYQTVMRLQVANKDRASAIRTYHRCKTVLRRELGVQPGADTVSLLEHMLHATSQERVQTTPTILEQKEADTLIGRIPEQQEMERAWTSARSGDVCAVVVSGEPGIGKTRFAEAFLQRAEHAGQTVVRSRCHAGHGQVAYAPVAQWLRASPIRHAWSTASIAQRVKLARLVPEIGQGDVPSTKHATSDSWQKQNLYGALSAVFSGSARPLILFVDDLQWCDADSLEWLQWLLTSHSVQRLLVVGTVREEEVGRDHPLAALRTTLRKADALVDIPLRPLNAEESARLASQTATDLPEPAKLDEIYRSTKGNPLFIVETVRAGLQSTRIHAVIRARLASLSRASYELAGLASVVGQPFSFELLEKLSDWDERSLSQALDELWQRRIIEGRGGAEYDFSHDQLRDVAKLDLSPVRQRYLHRRLARVLSDVYRGEMEEWNGRIAFHYEQAGMIEQAVDHLYGAASLARHRFAYKDSALLLRRALCLLEQFPDSPKRSEQELSLLTLLGAALVTTDGYSAAEVGNTYQRALHLSRRLNGKELFTLLSGSWVFHVVRGEIETSRQESMEFLMAAERTSGSELRLAGHFLLGSSLSHLGQLQLSFEHLKLALEVHQETSASVLEVFGGPDVRVFCQAYLSHLAWHRAPNDEDTSALTFITNAVKKADDMGHPFIQAIALNYSAVLSALMGDEGTTLIVGRRAMDLCSRHGFSYYLAMASVVTAWAMCATGQANAGLEQFRSGLERMRSLGAELRLPFYYALLAQSYGRAGMLREASASLATGFAFAGKNGEAWATSELHRIQGDILQAEGRLEQARTSYRRALECAEKCGSFAFARRLELLCREL